MRSLEAEFRVFGATWATLDGSLGALVFDLRCFAGQRARFQGVWVKSLGTWRQGLGTLRKVWGFLLAPGKDLQKFCGLEERFVGSLREIRVWRSLEKDFQVLRNRVHDFWGL